MKEVVYSNTLITLLGCFILYSLLLFLLQTFNVCRDAIIFQIRFLILLSPGVSLSDFYILPCAFGGVVIQPMAYDIARMHSSISA